MKKTLLVNIIACMTFLLMHTACDQGDDQHIPVSVLSSEHELSTRSDCPACPGDEECCCIVWLQPGAQSASLFFCGTSNGLAACTGSATGNCEAFSGGGLSISLDNNAPRQPFCVNEDSPFYIRNTSLLNMANIIITCQGDLFPPDTMWLQIPANTTRYIETNTDCEVTPCD